MLKQTNLFYEMKKKKYDLLTTQEMIEKLQKRALKDDECNWKQTLLLLSVCGAILLLAIGIMWIGTLW